MAISHCYWHLLVKNGNFTLLQSSDQEHYHWHLVVKNGLFTLLLRSCGQELLLNNGNFTMLLTSSVQEWQFHIGNWHDISSGRMVISHCYWHLVVKNGNFILLLTSSDQEWQFHMVTHIWSLGMAIVSLLLKSSGKEWQCSHCYCNLVVMAIATDILVIKNGNCTLLLTFGGQEWQFHIATDI